MRRHSLRDSKRPEFYSMQKLHYEGEALKKKRKKKAPRTYPEEALLRAAEAYLNGDSRNHAARLHRVSAYQILKVVDNIKSVFTFGQEKELAAKIMKMISRGFVLSESDVRTIAYAFAEAKKLPHNFCPIKKMAGIDWILSFKKSHPDIPMVTMASKDSTQSNNVVSKEIICKYFKVLSDTMHQFNPLNTPHCIYNVGKTVFVTRTSIKRSVKKKNVTMVTVTDAVTMLICANAAGQSIPPMAIYYGQKHPRLYERHMPKETLITTWERGEPGENIFLHWLHHFEKLRHPGPCLLLLDGNPWHKNFEAFKFCESHKIQMLCVPTQSLHPLNTVLTELESDYNINSPIVVNESPKLKGLKQRSFGRLFSDALTKTTTPVAIQNGFFASGVYPLNETAMLENQLLLSSTSTRNSPLTTSTSNELTIEATDKQQPLVDMDSEKTIVHGESLMDYSTSPLPLNLMVSIKQEITLPKSNICENSDVSVEDASPEMCGSIPLHTVPAVKDATAVNSFSSFTTTWRAESSPENKDKCCSVNTDSIAFSAPVDELKEDLAETCLFCYVKFSDPVSMKLGNKVRCQGEGGELFHQRCVGAKENEGFICGRCVVSQFRARCMY